jgi:hypothetical protein
MLKNLAQLEHEIDKKVCRFICDHDTPIQFIKESLFQFQRYIGQAEDLAKAQMESQKNNVPVIDSPSTEEVKNE